jgi:hypothetical protein
MFEKKLHVSGTFVVAAKKSENSFKKNFPSLLCSSVYAHPSFDRRLSVTDFFAKVND